MRQALVLSSIALIVAGCQSKSNDFGVRPVNRTVEADPVMDSPPAPSAATRLAAAQLAESQGRFDIAIEQYRAALIADPENREALYAIARLLTASAQYDQAVSAWERYVRATDDNPTAWTNLAKCHELAGQYREAEISYVRALQRDPTHRQARLNYGMLLASRDRVDEAQEQLGAVLTQTEVQYNIAALFEVRGEMRQARAHYLKALELDPDFSPARERLAVIDNQAAVQ